VRAQLRGARLTTRDLVLHDHQEHVLEGHSLLLREGQSVGQRVEHRAEPQPLERRDELGRERTRPHQTSSGERAVVRVWKCSVDLAKRGVGNPTTLPPPVSGVPGLIASLSILSMRRTSTTSKASAL
jgi:hypothetical protein